MAYNSAMLSSPRRRAIAKATIAIFLIAAAQPTQAQSPCVASLRAIERRDVPAFIALSNVRARSMLADAVECSASDSTKPVRFRPLLLRLRVIYAGGLPAADEDGDMWAGRGVTAAVRGGGSFAIGPLHVVLAPEIIATQNAAFDHEGSRDSSRSSFASPFYSGQGYSLDYPTQFG